MRTLPLLLLLAACGSPEAPKLQGQVTDIWDKPIEGVTILIDGVDSQPATDASGSFSFPMMQGDVQIKAGKEGYIQESTKITVDDPANAPSARLKLYPKPDVAGFYAVGLGGYSKIDAEAVHAKGTELETFYGLKSLGGARLETPLRVVFHTEFTYDQVQRMDLELVELEFTKATELQGAVGIAEAEIDLYTKKRIIPIEITAMKSKSDYLITVKEELQPGAYAFHTQGTLAPKDQESFAKIPDNLRIAFPLELR
ncbi:MAG: carboxypeptidase regulatory-like domain-containing protein [Deltaproteobacteria bacterium]|nr:MAG: carboxypeptidase regulatory-like domain-containing protein [Deltaproteobacteria bacterium]